MLNLRVRQTQLKRYGVQPLVARPQSAGRNEQMNINVAHVAAHQRLLVNQKQITLSLIHI